MSDAAATVIAIIVLCVVVVVSMAVATMLLLDLLPVYRAGSRKRVIAEHIRTDTGPRLQSVLEAAERDAASGHYKEAFRGVYLAAILILDRAALLKYQRGVTNWEYLRVLRNQPLTEPSNIFEGMTRSFDQLIYGKCDVSRDDYLAITERMRLIEESTALTRVAANG